MIKNYHRNISFILNNSLFYILTQLTFDPRSMFYVLFYLYYFILFEII